MFKMKGIGPQGLGTSKVKLTNDCCSPYQHCGCGIIGPNKIDINNPVTVPPKVLTVK